MTIIAITSVTIIITGTLYGCLITNDTGTRLNFTCSDRGGNGGDTTRSTVFFAGLIRTIGPEKHGQSQHLL
ncbi:hypothetical protein [Dictyobacter formicarum]|uniref:Secreted protein n=1 Tax=Dictyobacter formicarum TaxID=2778368 RepID=A0ABQ3VGE5_9CHLR|nr:hypothetical protein [Dictyobacter formicarum]GHO84784.1 hypothetical protein KSZ_27900 [Dictyobacter formicarum]